MRRTTVVWTCVGVIKWLPVSVACKNHFLKRQIQALKRGHFCVFQDPAPASAPAPERRPGPGARSHPLRQSASIFILFQLVLAVHKTVFNMSCCLFPPPVFVGSPFYAKCKRSARNWHKYGAAEVPQRSDEERSGAEAECWTSRFKPLRFTCHHAHTHATEYIHICVHTYTTPYVYIFK